MQNTKTPPPAAKPEPDYRAYRMASPNFVRCPRNCDPAIGCANCSFWGTVPKDSPDAKCVHTLAFVGAITSTLKTYQCTRCGELVTVDSSD